MSLAPVPKERIAKASQMRLTDADLIASQCRAAGVPFFVACALFQKESGGRNIYGNDPGGALAGFSGEVTHDNFEVFEWLVFEKGVPSNGVGPAQITYKGYFTAMHATGLRPWEPADNMLFGLDLLAANHKATGTWEAAAARYNGGPKPNAFAQSYGKDLVARANVFREAFGISGTVR